MSRVRDKASLRRASGYNPQEVPYEPAPPVPSTSRPRPSQPPALTPPANGMDRRKSRVDGLLQRKRQSISYSSAEAHRMAQAGPSNAPAVPSVPLAFAQRDAPESSARPRVTPGGLNLDEMDTEAFGVDDCGWRFVWLAGLHEVAVHRHHPLPVCAPQQVQRRQPASVEGDAVGCSRPDGHRPAEKRPGVTFHRSQQLI
jgi:hypothetical protein